MDRLVRSIFPMPSSGGTAAIGQPYDFAPIFTSIPDNAFVSLVGDGYTITELKQLKTASAGTSAIIFDSTTVGYHSFTVFTDLIDNKLKIKCLGNNMVVELDSNPATDLYVYPYSTTHVICSYVDINGAHKLIAVDVSNIANMQLAGSVTVQSSSVQKQDLVVTVGEYIFTFSVYATNIKAKLYTYNPATASFTQVGTEYDFGLSATINQFCAEELGSKEVVFVFHTAESSGTYKLRGFATDGSTLSSPFFNNSIESGVPCYTNIAVKGIRGRNYIIAYNKDNNNVRVAKFNAGSQTSYAELPLSFAVFLALAKCTRDTILLTSYKMTDQKLYQAVLNIYATPQGSFDSGTSLGFTPTVAKGWYYGSDLIIYTFRTDVGNYYAIVKSLTSDQLLIGFVKQGASVGQKTSVTFGAEMITTLSHDYEVQAPVFLNKNGTIASPDDLGKYIHIGTAISEGRIYFYPAFNSYFTELFGYINCLFARKITPDVSHAMRYNFWNTREVYTASGVFTVPDNVYYLLIICIGKGADATTSNGGGSGGICFKLMIVTPGQEIPFTISSGVASCLDMTANPASGQTGGTAFGGDYRYNGGNASGGGGAGVGSNASSVGGGGMVFISGETGNSSLYGGGGLGGNSSDYGGGGLLANANGKSGARGFPYLQLGIVTTSDIKDARNNYGFSQSVHYYSGGDNSTGYPGFGSGGAYPSVACGFGGGGGGAGGAGGFGGGGGHSSISGGSGGFGGGGGRGGVTPGQGGSACVVFVY